MNIVLLFDMDKNLGRGFSLFVVLAATLIACPVTTNPPTVTGKDFIINSPVANSKVGGPIFFSAQLFDPELVSSVKFKAGNQDLGTDTTPADGFRVVLYPNTFPAGALNLEATATLTTGKVLISTQTVMVVSNPQTSAVVDANGAVVSSTDTNGATSTLTIPPDAASVGATVNVQSLTKQDIKTQTGVDFDAAGITYLGAQKVNVSSDINAPIAVSSSSYGNAIMSGERVFNWRILPDLDGDGQGELVLVNNSVGNSKDVLSSPIDNIQIGDITVTQQGQSTNYSTLQSNFSAPSGAQIDMEVTGFSLFSLENNLVSFEDSNGNKQFFKAVCYSIDGSKNKRYLRFYIPTLSNGIYKIQLINTKLNMSSNKINFTLTNNTITNMTAKETIFLFLQSLEDDAKTENDPEKQKLLLDNILAIKLKFENIFSNANINIKRELDKLANFIGEEISFKTSKQSKFRLTEKSSNMESPFIQNAGKSLALFYTSRLLIIVAETVFVIEAAPILFVAGAVAWIATQYARDAWNSRNTAFDENSPTDKTPSGESDMGSGSKEDAGSVSGIIKECPKTTENTNFNKDYYRTIQPKNALNTNLYSKYLVKINIGSQKFAFSGLSDYGGEFHIPFVPINQPFTATATNLETKDSRVVQGIGASKGHTLPIFFDFTSKSIITSRQQRQNDASACDSGSPPPRDPGDDGDSIGDPHYVTSDGYYYDYQGSGEYWLVQDPADAGFGVQTRLQPWQGSDQVSINSAVSVKVGSDTVSFYSRSPVAESLRINGVVQTLGTSAVRLNAGWLYREGALIYVQWDSGDWLQLGSRWEGTPSAVYDLSLHLADIRKGRIRGLLGNFDGNQQNDFILRNGTVLPAPLSKEDLHNQFGSSWRISQTESLFTYGAGETTDSFVLPNFPKMYTAIDTLDPTKRAQAEQICRAKGITAPIALNICILDVATTNDAGFADAAKVFENNNPALSSAVQIGSEIVGSIDTAGQRRAYTFSALAGQKVFILQKQQGLPSVAMQLTDSSNAVILDSCLDCVGTPVTLTQGGTYTLTVGTTTDTNTGTFAIRIVPQTIARDFKVRTYWADNKLTFYINGYKVLEDVNHYSGTAPGDPVEFDVGAALNVGDNVVRWTLEEYGAGGGAVATAFNFELLSSNSVLYTGNCSLIQVNPNTCLNLYTGDAGIVHDQSLHVTLDSTGKAQVTP